MAIKNLRTAAAPAAFQESKPERELFAAVGMSQRCFVAERHQFFAQFEPAAQMRRRMGRAPGPADADERASHIEVRRVLPDFQECNARPFRKSELEVARFGKPNQDFADQRRPFAMIQKLAVAGLPVRCRPDELMNGAAARQTE